MLNEMYKCVSAVCIAYDDKAVNWFKNSLEQSFYEF